MESEPIVAAVVVAFGAEPWLERAVEAIRSSEGVCVELVVVDNGCTDGAVDRIEAHGSAKVIRPGHNTGFAGGCNLGVDAVEAEFVALVNPDAIVRTDALWRLCRVAATPGVAIATASIVLSDQPWLLNSGGNEIHFLGSSWAGSFEQPLDENRPDRDVMAASGAGMVVRRSVWDELGGFCTEYFAYFEDAELSLRAWLLGQRVVYVPGAVIEHRYEFSRNELKSFLIDRNRMALTITCFSRSHLLFVLPLLVLQELAISLLAWRTGWWAARRESLAWIVRNAGWIRRRRSLVQHARKVDDSTIIDRFSDRLDPGNFPLPAVVSRFEIVLSWYWRLVRGAVGRGAAR